MDCWERKRPQLFVLFLPPLRIVFCLCYFLLVFQTIDGVGFFLFLEKLFLSAFKNDRLLCPINENFRVATAFWAGLCTTLFLILVREESPHQFFDVGE